MTAADKLSSWQRGGSRLVKSPSLAVWGTDSEQRFLIGQDTARLGKTPLDSAKQRKTRLDCAGLGKTRPDWAGLRETGPDCASLG